MILLVVAIMCMGISFRVRKRLQGIEKLNQTNLGDETKVRSMHLDVGGIPHL